MRRFTDSLLVPGFLLGVLFTSAAWGVFMSLVENDKQQAIVDHGYAIWHPKTGEFTWLDEYEKKQP